jgi:hypothetical protein
MKRARKAADAAWRAWCKFWFESQAPARWRLFRVTFGWFLFIFYAFRTLELDLYFSDTGIMPLKAIPDIMPMDARTSLLYYLTGAGWMWGLHLLFLASLAALALGLKPRIAAIVAYVLHISFLHRDMAPSYGVDMISSFFLFYLCFADDRPSRGFRGALSSMAFRLSQVQICIIYAYSGLDKVKGPQWWAGEALWGVVSNQQLARWDFTPLSHLPLLLVAGTYLTLMWEIYFPVLIWVKPVRNAMLLFGVALHIGIGLVVNIPFFGALMILSYIFFVDEGFARGLLERLRRKSSMLPI